MVCMTKRALAGFIRLASRQTNKHIAVVRGDSVNTQATLSFWARGSARALQAV